MDDEDVFDSVTWETPSNPYAPASTPGYKPYSATDDERDQTEPKWEGYLLTSVRDPVKELAETKDAYVSYLVQAKTNLPIFSSPHPSSRRRFQDFVFLRTHLSIDFPACIVPALPDKHRLEYLTGDRFSVEFMEKRRIDLHRFLQRLARHPILQRSTLLRAFFESTEWNVQMHQHVAHPPSLPPLPSYSSSSSVAPSSVSSSPTTTGIVDNLSDTILNLNAFTRLKKPDERFVAMRDQVEKFNEGLVISERLWGRIRGRSNDLTADYHDMAIAVQGLGFLETGITDPLNHFSNTLLEFSALVRHWNHHTLTPSTSALSSLNVYTASFLQVLKTRDQKQLDFEELSAYLTTQTIERDRLSAVISGHTSHLGGLGLGGYIRERLDSIRGADDDRSRVEKMRKLDIKIKELEDAVQQSLTVSEEFNKQVLLEEKVWQKEREAEVKEVLGDVVDGGVEFWRAAMEEWDRVIPVLQRIRVDV